MHEIDQIKADFRNFVYVVWKHLRLPDPTPVQYQIAYWLQHGEIPEGGQPTNRMIIEAFRGVGKSWITSAFVLWCLLNDPELKFLIVSASKQRADDFSIFTQLLISGMPILKHLEPHDDQRSSKIAFDVGPCRPAHAPSVKSVGIFGQMTGSRANIIIADDIEVPNNSDTEDKRDKLLKTALEFEAILSPGGRIIYLGTPQTESSVYNKLRERGYKARIWPARYPTKEKITSYDGDLAPDILTALEKNPELVNRATDPKRFNDIDLLEREAAYGRSGFALQFMLDTTLSDAERYPLKTTDLIAFDCQLDTAPVSLSWGSGPQQLVKDVANVGFTGDRFYRPLFIDQVWAPYQGSVMFIDPAGRGKDETGYAVVKLLHGKLYLTAFGGLKGGYDDPVLLTLAHIAKEQKVNRILIESNFGDGMFTKILTPVLVKVYPCTTEEIRSSVQKERRIIDTLEPVMNQHRLVVDLQAVRKDLKDCEADIRYSLLYQMTHITKDRGSLKHEDRLDALAGAVAYWVESMARDANRAAEDHRDQVLDEELRRFMNHVLSKPPGRSNFLSNYKALKTLSNHRR